MKILLASAEVVPFAKTGGLADVCGTLPVELAKIGHQTTVIMPAYRAIHDSDVPVEATGLEFEVPIGSKRVAGSLLKSTLPGSEVPVYFVSCDAYFDRAGLFGEDGEDYRDNCERFVFFCRAVLEAIRLLDLQVDLLHCNDWQTGLLPAYLRTEYLGDPAYENIATLLTIHNIAYQGSFWHWDMVLTGIDWKYFNWKQMEFFGNLNLLKTGLAFADKLNTVSPRYAEEIQTEPLGCGLSGLLKHRRADLTGIINGVNYDEWNPETDPHLAANYNVRSYSQGKATCKAALQQEFGLPQQADVPLIGIVGRLADQKGFDLIAEVMQNWLQTSHAQWAILGTGDKQYHEMLESIAAQHPDKVGVRLEFSSRLAHVVEAGADLFLMPSKFEPCGLNQLYSMRYGTIPVVRATGGLADTVVNVEDVSLAKGTATGFSFAEYSSLALSETLHRACEAYQDKTLWSKLVETTMKQDWSWIRSAEEYSELYKATCAAAREEVCL